MARNVRPPRTRDASGLPRDERARRDAVDHTAPGTVYPAASGDRIEHAVTVVGSSTHGVAIDGVFTPALLAALRANPHLGFAEVLQHLAIRPVGARAMQTPSLVQYGRAPAPASGAAAKRRAVLIANEAYPHLPQLQEPIAEATEMKTELTGRGYEAELHTEQRAPGMAAAWDAMLGAANRGDELIAYFSGHGQHDGLAGIAHSLTGDPDLFTNAQVQAVVAGATSRGAQLRFILDSCYAGAQVDAIREERRNELAAVAGDVGTGPLTVAMLAGLRDASMQLEIFLCDRAEALNEVDDAIDAHRYDRPLEGDDAARTAWEEVAAALVTNRAKLEAELLRRAAEVWASCLMLVEAAAAAVKLPDPPPAVTEATLAAQRAYLDDLVAILARASARAAAGAGEPGAGAPPAAPPQDPGGAG